MALYSGMDGPTPGEFSGSSFWKSPLDGIGGFMQEAGNIASSAVDIYGKYTDARLGIDLNRIRGKAIREAVGSASTLSKAGLPSLTELKSDVDGSGGRVRQAAIDGATASAFSAVKDYALPLAVVAGFVWLVK